MIEESFFRIEVGKLLHVVNSQLTSLLDIFVINHLGSGYIMKEYDH